MTSRNDPPPPLCFAVLPPGRALTAGGHPFDGDAVAAKVLAPAAAAAGLELVRLSAVEIEGPGAERLGLFRFGVAELATAPAQALRAIGRWEGWRAARAVLVHARPAGGGIDTSAEAVWLDLDAHGRPAEPARTRAAVVRALQSRQSDEEPAPPICHLLDGLPPADPERHKTDRFRERIEAPAPWGKALAEARKAGVDAVRDVEARLAAGPAPPATAVDLFLSYRAVKGWAEMVELATRLEPALARTPLVREQRAMALSRLGRHDEAMRTLLDLLAERGASSETCGLLGRVYKDRWSQALRSGRADEAGEWLRRAIDSYLRGFEADPRDAYPGLNAVTLMEVAEPPDPRRFAILPVLDYVLALRVARPRPDYWDHASLLEVAVLRRDPERAAAALAAALAALRETWEAETTANNLRAIDRARAARGEHDPWLAQVIEELESVGKAPTLSGGAAP